VPFNIAEQVCDLADLIAQCDPKAPPLADLRLWESARPVGKEVW